jgi:hypothetical protein
MRRQRRTVASARSGRAGNRKALGAGVRRSLRGIAACRISAPAVWYVATLFLGLAGTGEARAFWIRIPSISIPRVPIPHVAPPRIAVPHIAPHIAVPHVAPRIAVPRVVRVPGRGVGRATSRAAPLPHGGAATRHAQRTPGLKRGISLGDRGSNATRHNSPTVDQPRQAAAPAKPAAQTVSRSSSTSRSAAPGHFALCTSSTSGGWVGGTGGGQKLFTITNGPANAIGCAQTATGTYCNGGGARTTTTCAPGTWLVLQLPLPQAAQGSDDSDWSDGAPPPPLPVAGPSWTDTPSPALDAGGGQVPLQVPLAPFDQKTASTNGDCVAPIGGTAFFGIPGNPDQPPLDCGNESQAVATASPADISQFPLVAEPGAGDYPDPAEKTAPPTLRKGAKDSSCRSLDWKLKPADPDLSVDPLSIKPMNPARAGDDICADSENSQCKLLNRLVSSIPDKGFKQFVKKRVNFKIRSDHDYSLAPITTSCVRESMDLGKCYISVFPEFWKIPNATAQELVLILETGKIASIFATGSRTKPDFSSLAGKHPPDSHLHCLASIYPDPAMLLGDWGDDSALGLGVISTIPLKRLPQQQSGNPD